MFRHVVLFSFGDRLDQQQKEEILRSLSALEGVVPGLLSIHAGLDAGADAGNFEMGVVVDFVDEEAWRGYLTHPAHAKVRDEQIRPLMTARSAVQMVVDT